MSLPIVAHSPAPERLHHRLQRRLREWCARRLAWLDPELNTLRWAPEGILRCNHLFTSDIGGLANWDFIRARQRVRFLPPPLHPHVHETHPRIVKPAVK